MDEFYFNLFAIIPATGGRGSVDHMARQPVKIAGLLFKQFKYVTTRVSSMRDTNEQVVASAWVFDAALTLLSLPMVCLHQRGAISDGLKIRPITPVERF